MSIVSKKIAVVHVPHSSHRIPTYQGYRDLALLKSQIELLTDWETSTIFSFDDAKRLVAKFNRCFCDVERLPDDMEPMSKVGRGLFYTHSDDGQVLRYDTPENRKIVMEYYEKHHKALEGMVSDKLEKHGECYIIDGHSFPDKPFQTDMDKSEDRADFCIGTDEFHTPKEDVKKLVAGLQKYGYSVSIDTPYSGTIVPLSMYQKEERVKSMMIEVNRRLYLMDGFLENRYKYESVINAGYDIRNILNSIIFGD